MWMVGEVRRLCVVTDDFPVSIIGYNVLFELNIKMGRGYLEHTTGGLTQRIITEGSRTTNVGLFSKTLTKPLRC